MKKLLICALFVFGAMFSSYAVPRGSYTNGRHTVVLVDNSGQIHVLDRSGKVTTTMEVIEENNDGSFACKVIAVRGQQYDGPTYYRNAYFRDDNGKLCLNLEAAKIYGTLEHE